VSWSVPRLWPGETVAIFGGGPSITQEQVNACRGLHSIAVNDAYLLAPWAEILYFADERWWRWHKDLENFRAFQGLKVSIEQGKFTVESPDVRILKNLSDGERNVLSEDPTGIATGRASGYQAINIAYLAGAKRIILLGFDCKFDGDRTNWHQNHKVKTPRAWLHEMPRYFTKLADALEARGVDVVNCSPGTALNCFRKAELAEVLGGEASDISGSKGALVGNAVFADAGVPVPVDGH
jgi:hypothetical protein